MKKENARVEMKVIFGRDTGEKTRGVIVRLNPKKAKVRILEDRGSKSEAGQVWGVPYSMMEPDPETMDEMTQAARALNEAVKASDFAKASSVIRRVERTGPIQDAVAKLILEATTHPSRTAGNADWQWLREHL